MALAGRLALSGCVPEADLDPGHNSCHDLFLPRREGTQAWLETDPPLSQIGLDFRCDLSNEGSAELERLP